MGGGEQPGDIVFSMWRHLDLLKRDGTKSSAYWWHHHGGYETKQNQEVSDISDDSVTKLKATKSYRKKKDPDIHNSVVPLHSVIFVIPAEIQDRKSVV